MKTNRDLSILIPARNEEWLKQTIEDLLLHKKGNTEILVGLDGYTPSEPLPEHQDLTVIHVDESIGQRAMQNKLAQMSTAKYVAKTDAHCAFDDGFDVKLMEKMEDDITMVPVMRNLHIFNWVCQDCGMTVYQGPEPTQCRNETCSNLDSKDVPISGKSRFKKEVVWIPKTNPQSSAYRFNKNLQFKYFPELRDKLPKTGLQESMSLQGSFFMCTREKYWELGLCDESWGSWGQQGSEVALKTWLSGGRVMCNMDTWYAHLFRTQSGFSFPYPNSGSSQEKARRICQDIFLHDKWDKAIHPLSWLLDKFWFALKDVKDEEARWKPEDLDRLKNKPSKGIIYYTDNEIDESLMVKCQEQIKKAGLPIVSASLKPIDFGTNIVVGLERGYLTMARQILIALEQSTADIIFFCEHDVLYHPSHFDFTPSNPNIYYYNTNVWKVGDGHALRVDDCRQLSGLCGYQETLIKHYKERVRRIEAEGFSRKMGFEPGTHNRAERIDDLKSERWESAEPNVDIRHGKNLTSTRWKKEQFRNQKYTIGWTEGETPMWARVII